MILCDQLSTNVPQEHLRLLDALGADVEMMDVSSFPHHLRHQRRFADPGVAAQHEVAARVFPGEPVDGIEEPTPAYEAFGLVGDQPGEVDDLLPDTRRDLGLFPEEAPVRGTQKEDGG